jgi:hypothetical protein
MICREPRTIRGSARSEDMNKCKACPNQVTDSKKSIAHIAEMLKTRTVVRERAPADAAQTIGPLCDICLPRWESTLPKA